MTAVITGMGVVSPFGAGVSTFFEGLCTGRSAVSQVTVFDAETFPVKVAAQVPRVVAVEFSNVDFARDRKVGFALIACKEALQHAKLTGSPALSGAALSLALGLETALLGDFVLDGKEINWRSEHDHTGILLRTPVDLAAIALRTSFGIGGREYLHMSACAAGAAALACAASFIERNPSQIVICGGADSMINPLGLGGMARLGATSPRNAHDACRPFDVGRDGLVMGEGAAIFVVEHESAARARGATPLARITGWATTQDAYKASAPRPDGQMAIAAMRRALEVAGIAPADIDYINAHGTGTLLNDVIEANAIFSVFGNSAPPTSSIKGSIGHAMAAAGALELAACVQVMNTGRIPGTTGLMNVDPKCNIEILKPGWHSHLVRRALSNSFGFGGHNACVILEECA
jgi:3-oxoacyl-[acyl-carrier-protein] synthase II